MTHGGAMIPTQYKAKLPRHLSYPIGAESLSEALAGAPHVESLSVTFSVQAVWPGPSSAACLPRGCLTGSYRPSSGQRAGRGSPGPMTCWREAGTTRDGC